MRKLILLLLYVLTAGIFLLCHLTASSTVPFSAGNGNVALYFIIILIPILIGIVYLLSDFLRHLVINKKHLNIIILLLITQICLGIFYQYNQLDNYRDTLANAYFDYFGYHDMEYIHMITVGFSSQLNNQYFNLNTWFMFLSFTILSSLVVNPIKKIINHLTTR
ncbi:hypothetical protein [Alkalicoccobacillus murimartini]|uniref:Uncharacterized protein n=1 Tax=Alkalicoccobacillus murimartini TaxID=171685 RepID=A0ABT9YL79_9BACI|nr:hypothetical protein [Alkalicoccobacillus murimartini]MDQ0208630.1 hypothetical protein [Alkalicoccobacillus murimartini]